VCAGSGPVVVPEDQAAFLLGIEHGQPSHDLRPEHLCVNCLPTLADVLARELDSDEAHTGLHDSEREPAAVIWRRGYLSSLSKPTASISFHPSTRFVSSVSFTRAMGFSVRGNVVSKTPIWFFA
jgi:hypothetical protein